MKKNILILLADYNSVNLEIIKKSLFFFKKKRKNNYIFISSKKKFLEVLGKKKINLNIINIKKKNNKKHFIDCFSKCYKLLKEKKAHGLINLPLNKKLIPGKLPGFTEYISKKFNRYPNETMLLFGDKFSVCPNTTHIPLKKVHLKIHRNLIKKNIFNINFFYKNIINIKKPKIAMTGLNPHNGMDFNFITEEIKLIKPIISEVKKNRINIYGPISPDSVFNKIQSEKYNCIIGHYHDQVLPTFKYINKFNAVNITLGLPFIRISPDHGPAKDIKGKNVADPSSFLYGLNFFEKYSKKI